CLEKLREILNFCSISHHILAMHIAIGCRARRIDAKNLGLGCARSARDYLNLVLRGVPQFAAWSWLIQERIAPKEVLQTVEHRNSRQGRVGARKASRFSILSHP